MLNERIRFLRAGAGMSQVELANRLGVTKQSVSNWENDNIQPSIEMLLKLSEIFKVSSDFLLGIDNRKYLDVTGLTDRQLAHVRLLVADLVNK